MKCAIALLVCGFLTASAGGAEPPKPPIPPAKDAGNPLQMTGEFSKGSDGKCTFTEHGIPWSIDVGSKATSDVKMQIEDFEARLIDGNTYTITGTPEWNSKQNTLHVLTIEKVKKEHDPRSVPWIKGADDRKQGK